MIHWKTAKPYASRYPVFRVACNMCDGDVLRRVSEFAGVGRFSGPHQPQRSMHSEIWRWHVDKRADVFALCARILPLMGERRAAKIRQMLDLLTTTGRPDWRHGTRHGYEAHKCRCASCKAAHAKRFRDIRARKRAELQAAPA
jgi:hypothetical protein